MSAAFYRRGFYTLVVLQVLSAALVLTRSARTPTAGAQYSYDFCEYRTETRYFGGGGYTQVVGAVARWNSISQQWEPLYYGAAAAIGSYNCKERY